MVLNTVNGCRCICKFLTSGACRARVCICKDAELSMNCCDFGRCAFSSCSCSNPCCDHTWLCDAQSKKEHGQQVPSGCRFQADLRLPPSVHGAARQAQVQQLIQQLGLQKVCHADLCREQSCTQRCAWRRFACTLRHANAAEIRACFKLTTHAFDAYLWICLALAMHAGSLSKSPIAGVM